jgi:methionine-rich copper-binding protein CopC
MSIRTPLAAAIVAGLFTTLLVPTIALGHAELDTATPKDKATVQSPPTEIVMTFTEPVVPSKSSIKLVDASGKVIADGSTVDAGDAKTMRLAITGDLTPATYTVRWTTASALDGDLDHGTTTFTVAAAPSIAPSATPVPSAATASAPASSGASVAPPLVAPSPSPSSAPTTPAASTSDAVIPVVIAVIVLAALGLWLMRGRSRSGR